MGEHIGFGDDAIFKTLYEMKRLARRDAKSPIVMKYAGEIKAKCKDDEACLLKKIFNTVYKNVQYQFDDEIVTDILPEWKHADNTEYLAAPKYLFEYGKGDCDDMATAVAAVAIALGIPVNFKIIAWKSYEFTHVYNELLVKKADDGKSYWIATDAVIGTFGEEKAPVKRAYVLRADNDNDTIEKIIDTEM